MTSSVWPRSAPGKTRALPGSFGNPTCVGLTFNDDGSVLVGGGNGVVIVWDVATGRQIGATIRVAHPILTFGFPSGPGRVVTAQFHDGLETRRQRRGISATEPSRRR